MKTDDEQTLELLLDGFIQILMTRKNMEGNRLLKVARMRDTVQCSADGKGDNASRGKAGRGTLLETGSETEKPERGRMWRPSKTQKGNKLKLLSPQGRESFIWQLIARRQSHLPPK
ncbi:hypothetical protein U0070_022657, partial [Myodes glareolus]